MKARPWLSFFFSLIIDISKRIGPGHREQEVLSKVQLINRTAAACRNLLVFLRTRVHIVAGAVFALRRDSTNERPNEIEGCLRPRIPMGRLIALHGRSGMTKMNNLFESNKNLIIVFIGHRLTRTTHATAYKYLEASCVPLRDVLYLYH